MEAEAVIEVTACHIVGIEILCCGRVPTARLTPKNEYISNYKHNVESTNLDLN